jgi:hypothetical protein
LVAVGVGVGVPLPSGAWISTVMGDPVLKKPVIQRAPVNSLGILILRKRFCLAGYGASGLIDSPGSAAISMVIKSAVVWPARFLRRRVKSDVTNSELTVGEIVKHVTLPGCAWHQVYSCGLM